LVVIATVVGVLVSMNKVKIPGLTPSDADAGADDVSTVVDAAASTPDEQEQTGPDEDGGSETPDGSESSKEGGVPTLSLEELELEKQQSPPDASDDSAP
jgi:hypothetical protein